MFSSTYRKFHTFWMGLTRRDFSKCETNHQKESRRSNGQRLKVERPTFGVNVGLDGGEDVDEPRKLATALSCERWTIFAGNRLRIRCYQKKKAAP